ncbi:MAG: acyl-ACP--UDP-N-acetylglucosamine O-acyltransferase [Betaproteobacteria bacterium]
MIHPSALVHPAARLAEGVSVGPFAVIGEHVEIGTGSSIGAHAVITGRTRIGADNRIFQFASIGDEPQDKKYAGEPTRLEIGDRNTIREFCTVNCGTVQDAGVTRVGNDNWIMAYVHIAHDCVVGDHVIMANCTQLAGHVHVGDWVILGGFSGAHQFCHIGAHAMTAIATILVHDLPPFVMAKGDTASAHGINSEGLKRRGFSAEAIAGIRKAYKTLYRTGLTLEEARKALTEQVAECPEVGVLVEFLERTTRGIVR